jgi:hypothetical protein
MHVFRCVSLTLLLLVCALSAQAQQPPAANTVESMKSVADVAAEAIVDAEHIALQKAEQQEHATEQAEHAPISHEKPPAALEDVDEFKGGAPSIIKRTVFQMPRGCTLCRP